MITKEYALQCLDAAEEDANRSFPSLRQFIEQQPPAANAAQVCNQHLRWHLDEDALRFLNETITADDEQLTEILLHVGFIREDDGSIKYGLLVSDGNYPEEGASLLVETAAPSNSNAAHESKANSLAGFIGGFVGVNKRKPTEQEIWDAASKSGQRLSANAAQDVLHAETCDLYKPHVLKIDGEDVYVARICNCKPAPQK